MSNTAEINAILDSFEARGFAAADIAKAFTQATGLNYYDLQPEVARVYPEITPLIKFIPRAKGNGGTGTNWKAVLTLNSNAQANGLVGEGNRGALQNSPVTDFYRPYRTIGLDTNASFEAQAASEGLGTTAKDMAAILLLDQARISEELLVLGGNGSLAGAGVALDMSSITPTVTPSTGSALAAQAWSVVIAPLSFDAWHSSNGAIVAGSALPTTYTRTNADKSTDDFKGGVGKKSAAGTGTTAGGNLALAISWKAVDGAFGYGVYVGAPGSETLQAVTIINSVIITSIVAGTQLLSAIGNTDNSKEPLAFDGLLTQIVAANIAVPGSCVVQTLATGPAGTGTPLTSDGNGGITQFNEIFRQAWALKRISYGEIWMSGNLMNKVQNLIAVSGASGNHITVMAPESNGQVQTTAVYSNTVLNKFAGGKVIKLRVHPDLPDSVALFTSMYIDKDQFPSSNLSTLMEIKARREWYQIEYPQNTRKYESGVYAEELLAIKSPAHFGLLGNIGG